MILRLVFVIVSVIAFLFIGNLQIAEAASLTLEPASGTFTVGGIINVSLNLDTQGEFVNAIEAFLTFPRDKLQLVSPTTGSSIIEIWTSQPRFSNQNGTIELRGGIPRGINVSKGLITTLRFRVKSTGSAIVKLTDKSRVLLNDGKGTDVLYQTQNALYQLVLPPPAGPNVVSKTHPDQSTWYPNSTAALTWTTDSAVNGYSYVLNSEPIDDPDDTSEGIRDSVAYRNLADGRYFFHIKALRSGSWGGTTHFAIQVDTTPPAEFPIEIIPSDKTTETQPSIRFVTTDISSGMSHYELKIVSLKNPHEINVDEQPFFIEAESPYILSPLGLGTYDVIVRPYDNAGNSRDVTQRFRIVTPVFQFIAERGLVVKDVITIPWIVLWILLVILIAIVGFIGLRLRSWHHEVDVRRASRALPEHVQQQLGELKRYQARYGKALILFLIMGSVLFSAYEVAAQQLELGPPFVTAISKNISNDEIFYVGGKTEASNTEIIIYLQNTRTGETLSQVVQSDNRGDWFYRHNSFLSSGDYLLWVQSKLGEQISPPSPQIQLSVQPTAIQFGASRISYEILYLSVSVLLFVLLVGVGGYTLRHARTARRKHREFMVEVREAEESIRRGFAVLRRDIQAELAIIDKARLSKDLSEEEKKSEAQLLKDLEWAQQYIGKEVWDIKETEDRS